MVTRAIVKKIDSSNNSLVVQVPKFGLIEEGSGEEEVNELPTARIATTPGCSPNYKVGDTVFICIEDTDLSSPVVMGIFIPNNGEVRTSDAKFDSLEVIVNTKLSEDTSIGKVTKDEIKCLEKVNENIQQQFDRNTQQKIELMEYIGDTLDKYFVTG